jgi:uncharacterized protein (TIGR02145 family)
MKNRLTTTGLILMMVFIYPNLSSAQDYMITFSGSGLSNAVETVEVKNITQQTSITLNGSDTLHLAFIVGISPIVQENAGMKVFPNPARHTSRVEFYNPEAGNINFEIIEISGKTLSAMNIYLSRGLQTFDVQGLGTGIYLLKATTETTVYQQRLVTLSQGFGYPQINYLGAGDQGGAVELKSTKNIVFMQYNAGERLVIKGISGDHSHTISLIPVESRNIDFEFIESIDEDGNQYGVVTIGDQVWMQENLKTTTYSNGNSIPNVAGADDWSNLTTGAFVWYDNDISWKDSYGALYNWFAANNANGLCPAGWHVPSFAEWLQLVNYVESQGFPNTQVTNGAGSALKSCRQVNSPLGGNCNTTEHPRWGSDNTYYGFDAFGFSGLGGGFRNFIGQWDPIGFNGIHWSSTEVNTSDAWVRFLHSNYGYISGDGFGYSKVSGFSVRCIRD